MPLDLTPRPGTTDVCLNLGIGLELDESTARSDLLREMAPLIVVARSGADNGEAAPAQVQVALADLA